MACTFHSIAVGLRDLGMSMIPQVAHYTLMGIETLSLRMRKHVENATTVSKWLENDPRIEKVTWAGLETSPYFERGKRICPNGAGALFTVAVKGGYDACVKLVDSLELFSHVANLGDARSLIISRGKPERGAPVDRDRKCRRHHCRPRSGIGQGDQLRRNGWPLRATLRFGD